MKRDLNKEELKCLKGIYKHKINCADYDDIIHNLWGLGLVHCKLNKIGGFDLNTAKLTPEGVAYLEKLDAEKKRYLNSEVRSWISLFLSVCAIIISVIALIYK